MFIADCSLRDARIEDAPLLAAAQRAIAETPGELASRPEEITDEGIRDAIAKTARDDRAVFLVAERGGTPVGHALLKPRAEHLAGGHFHPTFDEKFGGPA